jgi:poly(A) polymerase
MTDVTLTTIPREQHPVSRKQLSPLALRVACRLQENGFEAFLVGGCVRDLLLGATPKDFDVATSATPEQVKRLFSNARLIGRRFKLVHILFGREVIEVATFRASADSDETPAQTRHAEHGMLLRDNVYGSIEDDAVRRDFTINALYYNPCDFAIYDYVGALADIQTRTLRMIGEPETRYREDPVRMLRAIRFTAKLDLRMAPATEAPLSRLAPLISNVAAARLFEEVIKVLVHEGGQQAFDLLRHYGLLEQLFPGLQQALQHRTLGQRHYRLIVHALQNTQERIRQNKPVTPAFLYAVLLWPEVQERLNQNRDKQLSDHEALEKAAQHVVHVQNQIITIPKRFMLAIREIWSTQIRLSRIDGKKPLQTLALPKFRAAYDFLLLREQSGEDLNGLGAWWTRFQEQHPAPERTTLTESEDIRPASQRRPRRRPRAAP